MNTHKAPEQATTVAKTTKLRESCDSCLVAKVKCSKTRPICGRCLANGATCGYSPSSRAGRKHRNTAATEPARNPTRYQKTKEIVKETSQNPSSCIQVASPTHDNEGRPSISASSGCSPNRPNPRRSMIESRLLVAQAQGFESPDFFPNHCFGEDFGDFLQFSPQPFYLDSGAQLPSPTSNDAQTSNNQSWPINERPYSMAPTYQIPVDILPLDPSSSSPSSDGAVPLDPVQRSGPPREGFKHPCDCFAMCLHALQALHHHSWLAASTEPGGLPFDLVLTINREALKGCGAMLDCVRCVSKTGSSISTMLLGTLFGKIISLYGAACFFRFGPSSDSQAAVKLAYGAYTLTGDDRRLLEMEIIILELKKVENILTMYQERFRNAKAENDESSVYNALTCYLDKNLRYILDFLQSRRG